LFYTQKTDLIYHEQIEIRKFPVRSGINTKIAAQTLVKLLLLHTPKILSITLKASIKPNQKKNFTNLESFYLACSSKVMGIKNKFGKAQTEIIDEQALKIQRIYVLQELHGKKSRAITY
jgi:hypothetical protein